MSRRCWPNLGAASEKNLKKKQCSKICAVTPVAEYNKTKKCPNEIANLFISIARWVASWDARKYPILPAFYRSVYSNVTLTESASSTLKCRMQLWLLEAA